jgi:protease YdgD
MGADESSGTAKLPLPLAGEGGEGAAAHEFRASGQSAPYSTATLAWQARAMMIRVPLLILAGMAIILAGRSALSQDLHPGIIGNDDRVLLQERGPPWDAVGQVNVAGFRTGFACTGTLIAPTLVVTAAHCVINPLAQKPYASKDIHFLAAVRGSENRGHATAQCLRFLPNFRYLPLDKSTPTPTGRRVPIDS